MFRTCKTYLHVPYHEFRTDIQAKERHIATVKRDEGPYFNTFNRCIVSAQRIMVSAQFVHSGQPPLPRERAHRINNRRTLRLNGQAAERLLIDIGQLLFVITHGHAEIGRSHRICQSATSSDKSSDYATLETQGEQQGYFPTRLWGKQLYEGGGQLLCIHCLLAPLNFFCEILPYGIRKSFHMYNTAP